MKIFVKQLRDDCFEVVCTGNELEEEAMRSLIYVIHEQRPEFPDVSLIRAMKGAEYQPGWEVDIYPSPEFLRDSIQKENLYIGEINDQIGAAMVLNHEYNESYNDFKWPTKAVKEEITVIHALGVHPDYAGHGFAAQMVWQAITIIL